MSAFDTVTWFVFLFAAVGFVAGLHLMNSPRTARRGNQISAAAMSLAVLAAIVTAVHGDSVTRTGWLVLILGSAIGSAAGLVSARKIEMTAMPQLVSLLNAVGGGAALVIALNDSLAGHGRLAAATTIAAVLGVFIGATTLSGSIVAAGKLQGIVPGKPLSFPGRGIVDIAVVALSVTCAVWYIADSSTIVPLLLLALFALIFGVLLVLPIGGADMPVVVSLLNAFTGTAVAMAGFVIDNVILVIAGALVGAAGSILTVLMARAMNRSIGSIIAGGYGTGDSGAGGRTAGDAAEIRTTDADDLAIQLAYAHKVIIVPGFGLAAAHAQQEAADLATLLTKRGIDVKFAIHPVAGRMPGHMNVLLAEANVPYDELLDLDEANQQFEQADVALVIGANDVTNPAARRPGSPIAGMPILDVDHAKSVVVIKRSMGHGYAGIGNELYTNPNTRMYFGDAKQALSAIMNAIKTLVG
ncbi:NAD(P)(+) transhydrogenase (Re/Si-specific) subunit beta [Mycolicibacterium fortuitum]|uniref:NAD(P)(+) transhydrogenase (Re/Si-specific) subunit beta n=1 Tax=Mycolicibacterium fortuitum TaxID=1766 RepID=UPI001CE0367D|nr:NAD(P)(+) transhydrogenase (Re/Si-specific) subunit beta [Mycolicibacterium fortuitum]MCA4727292.1 NAD(P)(+) transhydrogenase (Re/Si-specific) subunit beta [Mycolicibacterium fortuitum]